LELKEGDILVIKPPINEKWTGEYAKKVHDLIRRVLDKIGYKNNQITFVDDVNLGIISTDKSNYENRGE